MFAAAYADGGQQGFGDGVGGVISDPTGFGVGPDDDTGEDGPGPLDDIFLFSPANAPIPDSGSFLLTVPGVNLSNYNIGEYTDNPLVTVSVTDVPFIGVEPPDTCGRGADGRVRRPCLHGCHPLWRRIHRPRWGSLDA